MVSQKLGTDAGGPRLPETAPQLLFERTLEAAPRNAHLAEPVTRPRWPVEAAGGLVIAWLVPATGWLAAASELSRDGDYGASAKTVEAISFLEHRAGRHQRLEVV